MKNENNNYDYFFILTLEGIVIRKCEGYVHSPENWKQVQQHAPCQVHQHTVHGTWCNPMFIDEYDE